MQRHFVALHGTLGSYLRDALHEGSADAMACLPLAWLSLLNPAHGAGLASAGAVATGIAGGVEGALMTGKVDASAVKGHADAVRAAYGQMRGQLRSQIERGLIFSSQTMPKPTMQSATARLSLPDALVNGNKPRAAIATKSRVHVYPENGDSSNFAPGNTI
jgi:hypothetical protein